MEFECVAQNLRRASRLISRRYEEALRPMNLTSSQFTILQSLSHRDGLPYGKMSSILGFEQTTLSRLLRPLEKRGLLVVRPDPEDRRSRTVSITKAGQNHFDQARILWQFEHDKSVARMTAREWSAVKSALLKLSQ